MTVSSTSRITTPFIGTGIIVPTFPFSFKVFINSDILAVITYNGVQTTLNLTTDYSVTLNPDQDSSPGGTITLNVLTAVAGILNGILQTGATMVISSQVPQLQSNTLTNFGGFFPTVINAMVDRLTILVQQLSLNIGKCLAFPITDPTTLVSQLPVAATRANKVMGFDNAGNVLMYDQAGGLTTVDYVTPVTVNYVLSNSDWGNLINAINSSGDLQLVAPSQPLSAGWFAYIWNSSVLNNAQNTFFPVGSTFYGWKETQKTYLAPGDTAMLEAVGNGNHSIVSITRSNPRIRLNQNTTLFVNGSTGNDTNFGTTSITAFLTIQAALLAAQNNYDLNGFNITIQVANGTYTAGATLTGPVHGAGNVIIQGDTTTPGNVNINTTNNNCFTAQAGGRFKVGGFKMTTTSAGTQISATGLGSQIEIFAKVEFGATASGWNQIASDHGGNVNITATAYTISGGCASHFFTIVNGSITVINSITITLTGTPAWANAFATAFTFALISAANMTFSGSATGTRWSGFTNSVIDTGSGASATYFPGNANGAASSGAQYA